MKKKLVMLSLAIVLSLSGCGNDYIESEVELQTKATQEEVAIEAGNESENEAEADDELEETEEVENVVNAIVLDNHDGNTYTDWKIIQPYDDTYIKYRIPDDYAWYKRHSSYSGYFEDEMEELGAIWARDIDIPDEDLISWTDLDCYEVRFAKMNTCRFVRISVYDPEREYVQTVKETVEMLNQYPTSKAEDLGIVQSESTTWELMNITYYSPQDTSEIISRNYEAIDMNNPDKHVGFGINLYVGLDNSEVDLSKLDCEYWTENEVREFLETCVY